MPDWFTPVWFSFSIALAWTLGAIAERKEKNKMVIK